MAGKPGMHRNRSADGATEAQAITMGLQSGDPRDPNTGVRPKRIPMGQGMNLAIYESGLDDDDFYRHWIDEQPSKGGRLMQAIQAGYEHQVDHLGNQITRRSGAGTMYLMRLPIDFRKEDLAAKRRKSEATMAEQTRLKPNEYAPTRRGEREGGTSSMVDRYETENPYA